MYDFEAIYDFETLWKDEKSDFIEICDQIRRIIDHIDDKLSRDIFVNRLLYSVTLDMKYIRNIVNMTDVGAKFEQLLDKASAKKPILIYGAGKRGKKLIDIFSEKNWAGFIDMYKYGEWRNFPIRPLDEYSNLDGVTILVSNRLEYENIKLKLYEKGVKPENVILLQELINLAEQKQYFDDRYIQPTRIKSFVDAGCFDGTTSIQFANWINDLNCKIWAFEPDQIQYEVCKTNLAPLSSSKLYMMALSDEESFLKLDMVGEGSSHLNDNKLKEGSVEVAAIPMDVLLGDEQIDYIKMDTEGWELHALRGAERIIREQRPALAISLYHRRGDVLEIPNLLLKYNPEYRFSLGHYNLFQIETVLYAIDSSQK